MTKLAATLLFFTFTFFPSGNEDGWDLFAKVRFSPKKLGDEEYLVPLFDTRIRQWEGKPITLKGFYIPMDLVDRHTIIISKVANASCFFCGASGPETVAEVILTKKPGKMKADQIIEVKGILSLNDSDINHMNFILRDAEVTLVKTP